MVDDAYATIAETGASNVLVFDLPNFGNDLAVLGSAAIREWAATKCNTIWSWHAFGGLVPESAGPTYSFDEPDEEAFRAEISSLVGQIADANVPLMVGEFGYDWNAERQSSNFAWASERLGAMTALDLLPPEGYGLLVWHANGDSSTAMAYSLKADDQLTFAEPTPDAQLSEIGERFWALSQERGAAAPVAASPVTPCER